MTEQTVLKNKIMSYSFALTELTLFLDTHPNDKKALEMHAAVAKKQRELIDEYQSQFGPLTAAANTSTDSWQWINSPWPWENCEKGE